jgi:hypothetical protein
MMCHECGVTDRCLNDGDRIAAGIHVPCRRGSFFDAGNNFCDRENCRVVGNECRLCPKCVCKGSASCGKATEARCGDGG